MNNAGLFMRHWEDRYNPDAEKLLAAPIWVRLFGLPMEFWDPEILEWIGNSIGAFFKVAESTKRGKYTSYARICVYMNIAKPLLEYIEVEYHDEIWQQPIDYEHIPFRCRRCHEYGHLYRQCPQNREGEAKTILEEERRKAEGSDIGEKGFKEVQRRQKPRSEGARGQRKEKNILAENQNKFQVLQDEEEEIEDGNKDEEDDENAPMEIITETTGKNISQKREAEVEMGESQENIVEQMMKGSDNRKDNGTEEERIMKKLLQEWKNLDERFIPKSQKQQYKEAFQKYKEKKGCMPKIGADQIGSQGNQNLGMDGSGKGGRKRGRRIINETIQAVGEILVNSGRVIPLSEETKMDQQQLQEIMKRMRLEYEVMAQDAVGSAGGLAIIWNPEEVIFENWISLPRILTGFFRLTGVEERILISGVYGPHLPKDWKDFLKNVQVIRRIIPGNLWIIGGDFNLIRDLGEKKGGIRRPNQSMEEFNELITEQRLVDIPTTNGLFTWNNRRGGRSQIASRLDRFLLSEQKLNRDVFIETKILPGLGSDHWSIRLEIDIKKNNGKKPFRFEAFWLRNPNFLHKME
eukprot:PITA_04844